MATDEAILVHDIARFWQRGSPNPARISSLIKQHVSQCLKDYYEWHFTSKMPTSRKCRMCARCLQIIAQ